MKYTPPKPNSTNHNVTQTHPLHEFGRLILTVTVFLVACWFVIGWAAGLLVQFSPPALEEKIAQQMIGLFGSEIPDHPKRAELQAIVEGLGRYAGDEKRRYTVHVVDNETENALSLPNGHIVILKAMVEKVKSENELAMILGHEIGHDLHRDHLRSLGRAIGLVTISSLLFGTESDVSNFFMQGLVFAQASYSRDQERRADEVGLELLVKHYGHAAGATAFFERMLKHDSEFNGLAKFQATHPPSRERIDSIREMIRERAYQLGALTPWGS